MRTNRIAAIFAMSLLLGAGSIGMDAKTKKEKDKKEPEKTRYEKIFDKKKFKTVESFLKMHLVENEEVIVELPENILGRDLLVTSAVDQTSAGAEGTIGYISPASIHISFEATDSLILMTEVTSHKYMTTSQNGEEAIRRSHKGAIIGTFPIKAMSPDSSAYVFDATPFFESHDERLDPADPLSSNSFDGLVSVHLTHQSSMSMLSDIKAYPNSISVTSYETYQMGKSALGMRTEGEAVMTVLQERSIYLLPEKSMRPRYADARIGVNGRPFIRFNSSDQGTKTIWYADRYDLGRGQLTFYVDTLFTEPWFNAIKAGIQQWNDAFAAIGHPDFLQVKSYPSPAEDPEFDANDMRYSCVKYEAVSNSRIRHNSWTDPRSGEIISSCLYIPFDLMRTLQARLLLELGDAAPSVRTAENTSPLLYDAIQSMVTTHVGACLGLTPNYMASTSVPLDSLRSVSYTRQYGLSPSIMDGVPYNYVAKEGDGEKGVCLIQKKIGAYDEYAIKWLYGEIAGAATPEEEVPALDKMIEDSRKVKSLAFGRKPVRYDVRYNMDPRLVSNDLGDDALASARERIGNLKYSIAHLDEWLEGEDKTYTFRPYMNTIILENCVYTYADLLNHVGGFYLEDKKDGDDFPSYQEVPAALQKEILNYVLDEMDDLTWLDNTNVYRDIYFVREFNGYFLGMIIDNLMYRIKQLAFTETVCEHPYTRQEAFDDLIDHILKNTKEGKSISENNLLLQTTLLGYTLSSSNAVYRPSGRGICAAAGMGYLPGDLENPAQHGFSTDFTGTEGFNPMPAIEFQLPETIDFLNFQKLLELKKVYEKAAKKTQDKKLKAQYEYFVMAIDRVLK